VSELEALGSELEAAIESVAVPAYVIDRDGIIRWLNPAAQAIVGDVSGRPFTSVVAAEDAQAAEHFERQMAGTERVADARVVLVGADGKPVNCEFSSVVLTDDGDRAVGVFGQLVQRLPARPEDNAVTDPRLTPRQTEVLLLLERGCSTEQIAAELHVSGDSVRRHIRHILRALGAHSRLEAVAFAQRASIAAR
jgi:PAS domain S-box-containing protein